MRLGKVQIAAVNGAATNNALNAFVFNGAEVFNIGHIAQAARGNNGDAAGLCQTYSGFDIDACEHTIAANIGVDDAFYAQIFVFFSQITHFVASHFAPAVCSYFAIFGIKANDDVPAKGAARIG